MDLRSSYYNLMSDRLQGWEARFDLARATTKKRIAVVRKDVGSEARELALDVRLQRDRLRGKLAELHDVQEVNDHDWAALRVEIEEAWSYLAEYAGHFRKSA